MSWYTKSTQIKDTIVDVVDLNDHMFEAIEKLFVQRELEYRQYVCDTGFSDRVFATQGEQSSQPSESRHFAAGDAAWWL